MALYTVMEHDPRDEMVRYVIRHRIDAARYHAHKMINDIAENNGLRDTKAAWNALRAIYATVPNAGATLASHRVSISRSL